MLKTLALLATLTHQTFAADDSLLLRTLTQEALPDKTAKALLFHLDLRAACAIPLLEARTPATSHIDPISRPAMPQTFDKMARQPDVKACPQP